MTTEQKIALLDFLMQNSVVLYKSDYKKATVVAEAPGCGCCAPYFDDDFVTEEIEEAFNAYWEEYNEDH